MSLRPLAQAFLEQHLAAGGRPFSSMSVEEARRVWAESLAAVPATYRCYEGMLHMVLGPEAMSDIASYLREHFL